MEHSGLEQLHLSCKNWGFLFIKVIVLLLSIFKILSTFRFSSFCAFTFPFAFAVMYDDAIAATWGTIIIVILGIELIAWITSPILILFKNRIASSIGIIGIIALNVSDAISCILSYMSMESPIKIANLIFTALTIFASSLLLWRVSRQAGEQKTILRVDRADPCDNNK